MPIIPFLCQVELEEHVIEVRRSYEDAGKPYFCPQHEELCQRIWTVPTSHVSRENVNDIMNAWTKGEGKPLSGHSMTETQQAALHMAKGQKSQQHQGSRVPNFTSFPGGPPRRNYTNG